MSKANAAKKARRKKRVAARNDRWMPADVHADLEAVTELDDLLVERGWVYDEDFSGDEFVTWFFPPSAVEVDDPSTEPVTRVILTDPSVPRVVLAGATADGAPYGFTMDELVASLDDVEAFRAGDTLPPGF